MVTINQMPEMFTDFLASDFIPSPDSNDKGEKEVLFIHSNENLILKQLGKGEKIIVAKHSIIAFSFKISFSAVEQTWWSPSEYVNVKGPGKLYIESCKAGYQGLGKNLMPRELTK
jgi:uncharacterized protein (AIM24 family)